MKGKRAEAIELLLHLPDQSVAEKLDIRPATLRQWMRDPKFAAELSARESEQRSSAARLSAQAVLNAAESLCRAVSGESRADTKLLIDLLKASGVFEPGAEDAGKTLAELVSMAAANPVRRDGD